jgi:hypothetical protein
MSGTQPDEYCNGGDPVTIRQVTTPKSDDAPRRTVLTLGHGALHLHGCRWSFAPTCCSEMAAGQEQGKGKPSNDTHKRATDEDRQSKKDPAE